MSAPSHTPGPWEPKTAANGVLWVIRPDTYAVVRVCKSGGCEPGQPEANARLIAAAPELLRSVDRLIDLIQSTSGKCGFGIPLTPLNNPCNCGHHEAYHEARAAIARALGQEVPS